MTAHVSSRAAKMQRRRPNHIGDHISPSTRRDLAAALLSTILIVSCCVSTVRSFNLDTKVRVRSTCSVPVSNRLAAQDDSLRLTNYMRLPVEQYALVPMPLNSTLSRLPGGSVSDFELVVPPVKFLWLTVQPVVHAFVVLEEDRVVITGDRCTLKGSPFIAKVKLNERFSFNVWSELTWDDTLEEGISKQGCDDDGNGGGNGESTIYARSRIKVDVDVPRPFSAIPKRVIEATGDKAMQLSLKILLRSFMKGLASDYSRWASDPDYRRRRADMVETTVEEKDFA